MHVNPHTISTTTVHHHIHIPPPPPPHTPPYHTPPPHSQTPPPPHTHTSSTTTTTINTPWQLIPFNTTHATFHWSHRVLDKQIWLLWSLYSQWQLIVSIHHINYPDTSDSVVQSIVTPGELVYDPSYPVHISLQTASFMARSSTTAVLQTFLPQPKFWSLNRGTLFVII